MSIIDSKAGVKTWREPGQTGDVDLKANKSDRQLTQSQKDALGADNIGDVLNKVSDPNYVDPSKKVRGVGTSKMDKDAFFKLMIAELKNQDPTNPLKNHEMAAQLAQFSGLEQMANVNTTLTEMKAGNKPIEQFQSLSMIGKQVSGDSSKLTRTNLDKEHDIKFNLPDDAKSTDVKIFNAKGELVRKYTFTNLKKGENKITWNGEDERGSAAKPGDYKVEFESAGTGGQKQTIKTDFTGVVTGISFSTEGPVLQVGKQNVRLKDIRQFSDPSLMSNDQKSNDITQLDLNNSDATKHTRIKEETKTPEQKRAMESSSDDMFGQLSAANELLNKVQTTEDKLAGIKPQQGVPTPPSPNVPGTEMK